MGMAVACYTCNAAFECPTCGRCKCGKKPRCSDEYHKDTHMPPGAKPAVKKKKQHGPPKKDPLMGRGKHNRKHGFK